MPWGKSRHHGTEKRKKVSRKKTAAKARKQSVADRHIGRRPHIRTVNAPKTW